MRSLSDKEPTFNQLLVVDAMTKVCHAYGIRIEGGTSGSLGSRPSCFPPRNALLAEQDPISQEKEMTKYTVKWSIHISADSPQEAARKALEIQRDPQSTATVFEVYPEGTDDPVQINLDS